MKKVLKYGVITLFAILSISYLTSLDEGGLIDSQMSAIENKVAEDAVKQYEIAKRNGSPMDAYVQAGLVSAAYLQANDEENYKKWKQIESQEAKAAGLNF